MTYTAYFGFQSRKTIALKIIATPLIFLFYMLGDAFRSAKDFAISEFYALRQDFRPAIRYILTGKTEQGVIGSALQARKAATVSKALSVRIAISEFVRTSVLHRVASVLCLVFMPILVIWTIAALIRDDHVFDGFGSFLADLAYKGVIRGQSPFTI